MSANTFVLLSMNEETDLASARMAAQMLGSIAGRMVERRLRALVQAMTAAIGDDAVRAALGLAPSQLHRATVVAGFLEQRLARLSVRVLGTAVLRPPRSGLRVDVALTVPVLPMAARQLQGEERPTQAMAADEAAQLAGATLLLGCNATLPTPSGEAVSWRASLADSLAEVNVTADLSQLTWEPSARTSLVWQASDGSRQQAEVNEEELSAVVAAMPADQFTLGGVGPVPEEDEGAAEASSEQSVLARFMPAVIAAGVLVSAGALLAAYLAWRGPRLQSLPRQKKQVTMEMLSGRVASPPTPMLDDLDSGRDGGADSFFDDSAPVFLGEGKLRPDSSAVGSADDVDSSWQSCGTSGPLGSRASPLPELEVGMSALPPVRVQGGAGPGVPAMTLERAQEAAPVGLSTSPELSKTGSVPSGAMTPKTAVCIPQECAELVAACAPANLPGHQPKLSWGSAAGDESERCGTVWSVDVSEDGRHGMPVDMALRMGLPYRGGLPPRDDPDMRLSTSNSSRSSEDTPAQGATPSMQQSLAPGPGDAGGCTSAEEDVQVQPSGGTDPAMASLPSLPSDGEDAGTEALRSPHRRHRRSGAHAATSAAEVYERSASSGLYMLHVPASKTMDLSGPLTGTGEVSFDLPGCVGEEAGSPSPGMGRAAVASVGRLTEHGGGGNQHRRRGST